LRRWCDLRRLVETCSLFPGNFPQCFVDPILPAWPGFLEIFQHVAIDAQRHQFSGVRNRRCFWNRFQRLCRCLLEHRFGRLPLVDWSSWSIAGHLNTLISKPNPDVILSQQSGSSPAGDGPLLKLGGRSSVGHILIACANGYHPRLGEDRNFSTIYCMTMLAAGSGEPFWRWIRKTFWWAAGASKGTKIREPLRKS